jgi:hypothetical protein
MAPTGPPQKARLNDDLPPLLTRHSFWREANEKGLCRQFTFQHEGIGTRREKWNVVAFSVRSQLHLSVLR